MKSKKPTQASPKKRPSIASQATSNEDINDIIADITLKRARNAFCIYICDMYNKDKGANDSLTLIDTVRKYSAKWSKVSQSDKEKYEKQSEAERTKFKKDINIVKNYLFKSCREGATAYRLFLQEKLKLAFENDDDPKEAKAEAMKEWKEMSSEERRIWKNKKKENDDWWERAKHAHNINAYSIFVQKKISEYAAKNKTLNFKDISEMWKQTSNKDKEKYAACVKEINEQRREARELYELYHGVKPKRPCGAFKIFLTEKAKEGKFKGKNAFREGRKMWESLSQDDKEKYLKLSHKIKLCYIYKMMLYTRSVKKALPHKPLTPLNLFFADMKGKKIPQGKTFIQYVNEQWEDLDEKERKKYEVRAEKMKKEYMKEKEKCGNRVFDMPKKAKTSFQLYVSEKMPEMMEKNPKKTVQQVMTMLADEWGNLSNKEKAKYNEAMKKEQERYEEQKKEFEEKGYYTEEKKKTKTMRSQSKSRPQSQSQSKKKKSQRAQSTKKK